MTDLTRDEERVIAEAFSDWAWNKEGEPVGYMLPHIAARAAFRAGAMWAKAQYAAVVQEAKIAASTTPPQD